MAARGTHRPGSMAEGGTLPWEGAGLTWCRAWWGGRVPQPRVPWRGRALQVLPLRENLPAGLRHRAGSRRSAREHTANTSSGQGSEVGESQGSWAVGTGSADAAH